MKIALRLPGVERWRLSTRFAALSLALLLVVQAAGYLAIRSSIERNAAALINDELDVGERVWQRLLEQRAQKLAQAAALLAGDYGFRSAVASGDDETLRSALENHATRIGAPVAALLDTSFSLRAYSGDEEGLLANLREAAATLASRGGAVTLGGSRPIQFVIAPIKAPVTMGWVLMGFPIDRSIVEDVHAVSGLHVALVEAPPDRAGRISEATLDIAAAGELRTNPDEELVVAGRAYRSRDVAIVGDRWRVRLLRQVDEAVAPYRSMQVTIVGVTALGALLFGLGSLWTADRVARPLRSLVRSAERFGQGQYEVPPDHTERRDEIGDLARAFDQMRVNIAAQRNEIRQLAYWDRQTGLPNRVQFRDVVHAAIEVERQAGEGGLAVLMLDLDRFKHVNDVLGFAFGDRLLKCVGDRLAEVVRDGDRIARLGGDEFAVLVPRGDAAAALQLGNRIAVAFERPLTLDDQTVDLGAAMGIACWPADAQDVDTLLIRAEVAMYTAKRRGTGPQIYDPAADTVSAETLTLLGELRHAIEQEQLRLYLQPKIDLVTGRVVGAEALVRWQHPQRGLVPPMQFIPFAEQTGFIRRLTLWMFEHAARQSARLRGLGCERIAINLSTRDLIDQDLPEKLEACLRSNRVEASSFCLEITESAIMDDPLRAAATLDRLAARGFKLSIDDFGTGYSSLAYLKRLPVQELKIDKSFVMSMEHSPGDATIVRSTIELAHNLGLAVVAEGVETSAIARALSDLACDEAQGYLYSQPLPLEEFVAWVSARERQRAPGRVERALLLH